MANAAGTEQLLTRDQAAQVCQVHPTTINRWTRKGLIRPVLLPTGKRRYRPSELLSLVTPTGLGPEEGEGLVEFSNLQPGQLVRIKRMHAKPGEQPPPIVVVEHSPEACGDGGCPDLLVTARDPVTGRELTYHRPPTFEVELWGRADNTTIPEPMRESR